MSQVCSDFECVHWVFYFTFVYFFYSKTLKMRLNFSNVCLALTWLVVLHEPTLLTQFPFYGCVSAVPEPQHSISRHVLHCGQQDGLETCHLKRLNTPRTTVHMFSSMKTVDFIVLNLCDARAVTAFKLWRSPSFKVTLKNLHEINDPENRKKIWGRFLFVFVFEIKVHVGI